MWHCGVSWDSLLWALPASTAPCYWPSGEVCPGSQLFFQQTWDRGAGLLGIKYDFEGGIQSGFSQYLFQPRGLTGELHRDPNWQQLKAQRPRVKWCTASYTKGIHLTKELKWEVSKRKIAKDPINTPWEEKVSLENYYRQNASTSDSKSPSHFRATKLLPFSQLPEGQPCSN